MAIRATERKAWARERFVGLQNVVAPSFSADFTLLDEVGIRLDVRQSIAHGFFATLCATDAGLTAEENRRFVEFATAEAGDELLIGVSLFLDNEQQMLALLADADRAGASFALLGFPLLFEPRTEDDVYRFAKRICEATDLGIVLVAHKERVDFGHLHPSGTSFTVLDRLAQIDNVVALHVGSVETGLISECFMRYREKLLVGAEFFGMAPLLVETFRMQWTGSAMYEALQSPRSPRAVELFSLLRTGRRAEAMALYWELAPGIAVQSQIADLFRTAGNDHHALRKYYQWCVGGNGGLTRQPHFNLFERQKDVIHQAYEAMDIQPTDDPEESFLMGRSQFGRRNGGGR